MPVWTPVAYTYDGTYAGFLSCVFESYVYREEPAAFSGPEDSRPLLFSERTVETNEAHARRVYRSFSKLGGEGRRLAVRGFLTCLPEKELHLWRFLRLGYDMGSGVGQNLTDGRVDILRRAVRHLEHEAHMYKGFVRFSDQEGTLVARIEPKNRVLPLLAPHFCGRFPQERFLICDCTHKEALLHYPDRWVIIDMDDLRPDAPGREELEYRRLWRRFYDTIAIKERYNPRCRMTQMPKRYWRMMTEFQDEDRSLPSV